MVSLFENNCEHICFVANQVHHTKTGYWKNDTIFRDIVFKGVSFYDFTQDTINLIFSHVNEVKRKQINGKSAYDMFTVAYSDEVAEVSGITYIPSKDVIKSKLLKKA